MACPICGSMEFYVKDPEDQYEIYEFEVKNGNLNFPQGSEPPFIKPGVDFEAFCEQCAWHGKASEIR